MRSMVFIAITMPIFTAACILLSQEATEDYEQARLKVAGFINAPSDQECVFTRGTTESINLVAHSFLRPRLQAGDEILISWMEHHSNIVPWQLLCEETGAVLKVVPMNQRGELEMDALAEMLTERVKLLAVVQVSNALGTVNPVAEICALARQHGIPVLVDGAQAVPHQAVDVQALDCDFYCFSGHKMYGPTGIGVLWGRYEHLQAMRPYQGGGEMIRHVTFEKSTFNDAPGKFEAGTPEYRRRHRPGRGRRLPAGSRYAECRGLGSPACLPMAPKG